MADELPEDFKVDVSHAPYGKSGTIAWSIRNRTDSIVDHGTVVDGEPRSAGDGHYNVPPQVLEKLRSQIKQVQAEADKRTNEALDARREAGPITSTETVSLSYEDLNQGAKEASDAQAEASKPKPKTEQPGAVRVQTNEPAATADESFTRKRRTETSGG